MKNVYCLRDNLSEEKKLGAPVIFDNDHQARRFLAIQVPPSARPTYSILRVACFNEFTGQFENFEPQDVSLARSERSESLVDSWEPQDVTFARKELTDHAPNQ